MLESEPIDIFISYAHEDEAYCKRLERSLGVLQRNGFVRSWHDRCIVPGQCWHDVISDHLERAQITILLVSDDFIASDYCYASEMSRALERHDRGKTVVVPVLIRPTGNWTDAPFAKLQTLPTDAKPITTWDNVDEAWADVADGIKRIVQAYWTEPSSAGYERFVPTLLLLLLMDRIVADNDKGAWGYSLTPISAAYGRPENPVSITVSYWAALALMLACSEDLPREVTDFERYLAGSRIGKSVAVGLERGGTGRARGFRVPNRRHVAVAARWWQFRHSPLLIPAIEYLANRRCDHGAWSAEGEPMEENADPLTTANVLRALLDAEADERIDTQTENLEGYPGQDMRWMSEELQRRENLWYCCPVCQEVPTELDKSRAYAFTADILATLPEFGTFSEAQAAARRGIVEKFDVLWDEFGFGIPAGLADTRPNLETTAQVVLAHLRYTCESTERRRRIGKRFLESLASLLERGYTDAAGWALTLQVFAELGADCKLPASECQRIRLAVLQSKAIFDQGDATAVEPILGPWPMALAIATEQILPHVAGSGGKRRFGSPAGPAGSVR